MVKDMALVEDGDSLVSVYRVQLELRDTLIVLTGHVE